MSPSGGRPRLRADPARDEARWPSSGSGVRGRWRWPMRRSALGEALPWRSRRRDGFGSDGWGRGSAMRSWRSSSRASRPRSKCTRHGGPAAVALVVEALAAEGAELRRPVAWVRHDARSAIAAEALVDLARAPTVRTAEILLEQAQGALEADVREALAALADDPAKALGLVDALLGRAIVGLRLIAGWRVVLAGRPNVGKSRLLNALTGYDRAIVDATPGTTRDVVTARTALEGWPVELADTAGLRPSDDPIEASGVALARARQGEADLVLVVLDRSEPLTDIDRAVVSEQARGLIVANKCDLPAAWSPADLDAVAVSAQQGDGIEGLVATVATPARPRGSAPLPRRPLSSLPGPPATSRPRRPRGGRSRLGGPQPGRDVRRASPPVRSGGLRKVGGGSDGQMASSGGPGSGRVRRRSRGDALQVGARGRGGAIGAQPQVVGLERPGGTVASHSLRNFRSPWTGDASRRPTATCQDWRS